MNRTYKLIFFLSIFVIFYFSVVPASSIPNIAVLSFLTDKAIHFLIFLYLSSIGLLSRFKFSNIYLLIAIFSFGLIIEIIHFYHPYRYFELADLAANSLGILLASFIFQKKD
ncbi:VanZ family protein [Gammaproteobacteria bacterium]|nr:VanZ family protein [Gammaproteobacteria bacterium]MDA7844807.1 VanZ family protein [Gammaproteobacteria bacterium]MDA9102083.1 VanZ family protein [Gammaproteobacteria bacterium]